MGDVEADILSIFSEAEERADIVVITGGLGPTKDDLTKPLLAKYFQMELQFSSDAMRDLELLFQKKGYAITDTNKQQAFLPSGCKKLTNILGTAPGMWFDKGNKTFVSLPGVPYEMKSLMQNEVIPLLQKKYTFPILCHKIIKTSGIGESWLSDIIAEWEKNLPSHIRLAYLPSPGEVKLRLTAFGNNAEVLKQEIHAETEKLIPLIPQYIFGYDTDEIETVLANLLQKQNLTLAVAESCSGGNLAHRITTVPGSSQHFKGGIIAYHNTVKINTLSVKNESIEKYGAVSEEVAKEMAYNVKKILQSDIGVATTGIAGPTGETPGKPIGTLWIGYSDAEKTFAKKFQINTDRTLYIQLTTLYALHIIRKEIEKRS